MKTSFDKKLYKFIRGHLNTFSFLIMPSASAWVFRSTLSRSLYLAGKLQADANLMITPHEMPFAIPCRLLEANLFTSVIISRLEVSLHLGRVREKVW